MDIRYPQRPNPGPLFCCFWPGLKLLSWDVNQTLVAENTMVALARLAGQEERAREIVEAQTAGQRPVKTTLLELARLSAGLSLEDVVSYVCSLPELPGLRQTLGEFARAGLIQIINSTGYTIVLSLWNELLRQSLGQAPFARILANRLGFVDERGQKVSEEEVFKVGLSLIRGETPRENFFLSGEIALLVDREEAKARLLAEEILRRGLHITEVAHIGDSMGDAAVLAWLAKNGGLGVAFNARRELAYYLDLLQEHRLPGQLVLVASSDLRDLAPVILGELFEER